MQRLWTILLLIVTSLVTITSYGQTPHLEGTIKISIYSGIVDADLVVTNLPAIKDYSIWLNTGLNIEYFRNLDDKTNYYYNQSYNQELSSESFQYYFPDAENKGKYLPKGFKIKYTGKFPVIKDTLRASDWGDWKGNMAFNGQTFRASEQSAWYPVLYDQENDVVIDKYTYNLAIECADGKAIYINGSAPQNKIASTFNSEIPVALLAFSGHYDFTKTENIYLLNADLNEEALSTLTDMTHSIIDFYQKKLSIHYGSSIVYLNTTPTSKKNGWMFVTFPTVAVIGNGRWNLKGYFDESTHQLKNKQDVSFIAHELGHYYFGTHFIPNSTLRWFFLEGVTDYISLQATKQLLGTESYDNILQNYISQISSDNFVPLNKINSANEIGETYRYRYVPLLLTAFEKEIGEERIWKWLTYILETKNQATDYTFFKSTLVAIIGQDEFEQIEQKYIISDTAKTNIIEKAR